MKVKKLAAAVAIAMPVGASLAGVAQPANAAEAALPSRCSGDLCMKITYISGNVATAYMWVYDDTLGSTHFELSMPNGRIANSPTGPWQAGGKGYTFADWNGGVGLWCGTLWSASYQFGVFTSVGHVCLEA